MTTMQQHWQQVHRAGPPQHTGWWEDTPTLSLGLVAKCGLQEADTIVDAGAGASTFIDGLLHQGFRDLVAIDISEAALGLLTARLAPADRERVRTIVADLGQPDPRLGLHDVALWHDRAALHFLQGSEEREAYAGLVRAAVRPGGFVLIAEFAIGGAEDCSGLPVVNYSAESIGALLGSEFRLLEALDHTYINRDGDPRPYVYTRFQRAG